MVNKCRVIKYPEHETTGGYLKVLDESECGQIWWNGLSDKHKDVIRSLPNFDADIFEQCTGIKINELTEFHDEKSTVIERKNLL